jgi:CheY-like chemotaxis protein
MDPGTSVDRGRLERVDRAALESGRLEIEPSTFEVGGLVEQMRALEEVDLILLDLMMPEVDGWVVREKQLDEGLLPDVPVVLMSGVSSDLSEEQAATKAAGQLVKPVRPAELYDVIETYCGGQGR